MIRRKEEMTNSVRPHMRNGEGEVLQTLILDETCMAPHSRVFSTFTLKKGCSIGEHSHTGETEYYYIISGEGVVTEADGDKTVKTGDVVITGGGASHAIRNEKDEDLVFVAVIILE